MIYASLKTLAGVALVLNSADAYLPSPKLALQKKHSITPSSQLVFSALARSNFK
jgi:hypothetical protein